MMIKLFLTRAADVCAQTALLALDRLAPIPQPTPQSAAVKVALPALDPMRRPADALMQRPMPHINATTL